MIGRMILLGATGDLAGRFLLPALAALHAAGRLPDDFRVLGAASEDWDDDTFRDHATRRLDRHAAGVPAPSRAAVARSLRYRRVDPDDVESVSRVVREATQTATPVAVYLALPMRLVSPTVTALGRVELPPGSRIVLEKPFGSDLDSAVALNALLTETAGAPGERSVFRVDHVLGMATVQNLLALRFANRILEPLWNSEHIDQIEILWEETLALEGRAGFYDRVGALKDVVQNHLFQILCLIAMEPPATLGDRDVQDGKCAVLRAVRPPTTGDVAAWARRARYTAGRLAESGGADGREVPAYTEETGVDPQHNTETFAEIVLEIPNERWAGTRFVLRAGKAMAQRRKGVQVTFRPASTTLFPHHPESKSNRLWIGLDGPEDTTVHLTGHASGDIPGPVPMSLTAPAPPDELPAYARVLVDILSGSSSLSVSGAEAEAAWRILTPVLHAWSTDRVPMAEYPAGSAGLVLPAPSACPSERIHVVENGYRHAG